ncbi:hypothetical protein TNCV_836141 [Trichonephila clavipes]|nr:hypothetical protein TNCV_836141 [Trichonephila clavipes]
MGGQDPNTSLSLPPTTREDLRLDGYLEYLHAKMIAYKRCPLKKHSTTTGEGLRYFLNPGQVTRNTLELAPQTPYHASVKTVSTDLFSIQ